MSDGKDYAQNAVVLKINGNLTIKEGVTLASIKNGSYGGPKGFFVYCTGNIKNDGIISMNYRGAYASGENVYLYKNSNGTFEFVPKIGSLGGKGISRNSNGITFGGKGMDAVGRGTRWWFRRVMFN